ncbi:hemerythrin family protein [Lachnospiraceae bacterium ZAX-1]
MYEMKEEYYTGIQLIDDEHTRLFEIIESLYQLSLDEFLHDKYDSVNQVIQELTDYTKKHFSDEEEYMKKINYIRIYPQKAQHRKFIDTLENIDFDEMSENAEKTISNLLIYLTDWLVDHILKMDKQIGH